MTCSPCGPLHTDGAQCVRRLGGSFPPARARRRGLRSRWPSRRQLSRHGPQRESPHPCQRHAEQDCLTPHVYALSRRGPTAGQGGSEKRNSCTMSRSAARFAPRPSLKRPSPVPAGTPARLISTAAFAGGSSASAELHSSSGTVSLPLPAAHLPLNLSPTPSAALSSACGQPMPRRDERGRARLRLLRLRKRDTHGREHARRVQRALHNHMGGWRNFLYSG